MTGERRYVPPSSLYLDQNPLLFFTLRGIDFEPLIGRTVDQKLEMMLANADKPWPTPTSRRPGSSTTATSTGCSGSSGDGSGPADADDASPCFFPDTLRFSDPI